jgi:quercetin dioxygenase-like cupin family protein
MDRKWKIAFGLGITLTGTLFALSFPRTVTGAIEEFPFPEGGPGPGFVQIQHLTLKPGDSTGWHHHDGPSWVILERGRGVFEYEACQATVNHLQAGNAFAEPPKNVHKVDNYGPGEATIWWATVYPQGSTAIVPEPDPVCTQ